jgi:hypothetical protein
LPSREGLFVNDLCRLASLAVLGLILWLRRRVVSQSGKKLTYQP